MPVPSVAEKETKQADLPPELVADLEALQKRRRTRQLADDKHRIGSVIMGTTAGLIAGIAVFLQEQYSALVGIARSLRHSEEIKKTAEQLVKYGKDANGKDIKIPVRLAEQLKNPEIAKIYEKFSQNADKIDGIVGQKGGAAFDPYKTFSRLFKHFSSDAYISKDEALNSAYMRSGNTTSRAFRSRVDEKVMDTLHNEEIVTLGWRHLSGDEKAKVIKLSVVYAVAVGAIFYGAIRHLTDETKSEKKLHDRDEAMAEAARHAGILPELVPSRHIVSKEHQADVNDFRERLKMAREKTAGTERVI